MTLIWVSVETGMPHSVSFYFLLVYAAIRPTLGGLRFASHKS